MGTQQPKHVVIVGGSVAGLAAAVMLTREGHRVTVLEKDPTPLTGSPVEAFESWDRRGSPQTRHSHAFLARLNDILKRRAPELREALLSDHGVEELRFTDMARELLGRDDLAFEPGDEDLCLLACRRITFEWVLRQHVVETGHVDFRDGVGVSRLVAHRDEATGLPRVTGVALETGAGEQEILPADLVLDATGRRSRLGHWLREIGAKEMRKDSEPCGIFYCSRFYRTRGGADRPELGGVAASDLGYLKIGVFPGDAGIFSITFAASPHDDEMRRILKQPFFDAAARALPTTREWVDEEVSEPISDVHAMANLNNTRCFFVDGGEPLALGVQPIGDALIHTNPINGRGCTLAFVNAEIVADALAAHPDDPLAFALAVDEGVRREIVPWYEATLAQDRDATEVAKAQLQGEDPFAFQGEDGKVNTRAYMRSLLREGLLPAMREDLGVLRSFMRVFNLLEPPQKAMQDPAVMQKALAAFEKRDEREPIDAGPTRDEMLGHLAAASA